MRRIVRKILTFAFAFAFGLAVAFHAVPLGAQSASLHALRLDANRFTFLYTPADSRLAHSLAKSVTANDTFPGLPRPTARVIIAIAPDRRHFREWSGRGAPEWGSAIAIPSLGRIVMQGRAAASDAGDPESVLRHELAHLALHEYLGDLPPRWFDEGYASWASAELDRDELLAANVGLAIRGVPRLDSLDAGFAAGARRAQETYALAYRAVADLAALDKERGLALFFRYWRETTSMDRAVRNAYGIPLASFESQWATRTRRRYGAIAVVADFAVGSLLTLMLVAPLYAIRRRRDRLKLAAMRQADEIAEREDAQVLNEMLGEPAARLTPPSGGSSVD